MDLSHNQMRDDTLSLNDDNQGGWSGKMIFIRRVALASSELSLIDEFKLRISRI
jgi:hypothetical protein